MTQIHYKSLVEMADAVRTRKISPVELVEAHLARIAQLNPTLKPIDFVDAEGARAQARAAAQVLAKAPTSESFGPLCSAFHSP